MRIDKSDTEQTRYAAWANREHVRCGHPCPIAAPRSGHHKEFAAMNRLIKHIVFGVAMFGQHGNGRYHVHNREFRRAPDWSRIDAEFRSSTSTTVHDPRSSGGTGKSAGTNFHSDCTILAPGHYPTLGKLSRRLAPHGRLRHQSRQCLRHQSWQCLRRRSRCDRQDRILESRISAGANSRSINPTQFPDIARVSGSNRRSWRTVREICADPIFGIVEFSCLVAIRNSVVSAAISARFDHLRSARRNATRQMRGH